MQFVQVLELLDNRHDLKELMRIEKLIDNRAIVIRIVEQKKKCIGDLTRQQVQISI